MTDLFQFAAALVGAEIDLKLLAHCFVQEECNVQYSEFPDIGNGHFYLLTSTTLRMESMERREIVADADGNQNEIFLDSTWDQAATEAERLLNVMLGAARLVRSQFKPVSIGSLHKFQLDGLLVGSSSHGSFGDSSRNYGMPPDRTGLTALVRKWVSNGLEDEAVNFALSIYGALPLSWSMLYMVYEVIQGDIGGDNDVDKLISAKERKDFTKAANNGRNLRSGPRHAKKPKVDQNSLITITLGESIIRDLLNKWLGRKVGNVMR